jgi:hypothetical protein
MSKFFYMVLICLNVNAETFDLNDITEQAINQGKKVNQVVRDREAEEERRRAQERGRQQEIDNGRPIDFVSVQSESICMLCLAENLQISGNPGRFDPSYNKASSGTIYKGWNGQLAGNYSWSGRFGYGDNKEYCAGSFYLSGKKRNVKINVYSGFSANINDY